MYLIGFESSCDETAASVLRVEDGKLTVLSDIIASQVETHRRFGGVVPEIAGRAHIEAISRITYEALSAAGIGADALDCVAVTSHPGLIGALLVAVNFAKSFALSHRLPLVEVDHMRAHIAAAYLTGTPPKPPFLPLLWGGRGRVLVPTLPGRGLPPAVQNLPVLPIWPQAQVQPEAGAAGEAGCWAPIW